MRICHVIFSFELGGAEAMLVDIVNEQFSKADISIIVINNIYNQALVNKIDKRVNVFFINRKIGSKNPYPIIRLNFLLFRLSADVIHCHNHNIATIIPIFKRKLVLTLHDVGITSKNYNKYLKLFAISNSVKLDIYKRSGLNAIRVYNGINLGLIHQKKDFSVSDKFKILIVSRLRHNKKGQHLALKAVKISSEKGIKNITLDIIGEGPSKVFLEKMTKKNDLENQINFLGFKDRNYIYKHIKDYDLLLQPSLYEGFGLTVVEAMAAKVPVLVSNIEGPMEVIENGKFGYFFEVGNPKDLSLQIDKIIKNYGENKFILMIEEARKRVIEKFDIKHTAQNYINSY